MVPFYDISLIPLLTLEIKSSSKIVHELANRSTRKFSEFVRRYLLFEWLIALPCHYDRFIDKPSQELSSSFRRRNPDFLIVCLKTSHYSELTWQGLNLEFVALELQTLFAQML